jgi:hypothetical protein
MTYLLGAAAREPLMPKCFTALPKTLYGVSSSNGPCGGNRCQASSYSYGVLWGSVERYSTKLGMREATS